MKRALAAAALLFCLCASARAVPNFVTKENPPKLNGAVQFSSAVIQSFTGAYTDAGGGVRVFYLRGSTAVYSARSADGLAFTDEPGVRLSSLTVPAIDIAISSITGATVLGGLPGGTVAGGGYRMLYSVYGTTGAFRVYTATSADGLNWANAYSTAAITSLNNGTSYLGSPHMVALQDGTGDFLAYYVQNTVAGNQPANRQIYAALSSDQGSTWVPQAASELAAPALDVSAIVRTDDRVRLYYSQPLAGTTTSQQILSALSQAKQGHVFTVESGVRIATSAGLGTLSAPEVVRSTDNFRWRMYYGYMPFPQPPAVSTANVFCAVTDAPDLQSISPSSVFNTGSAGQFTLTGEVLDTAMVAQLNQGAAVIAGGGYVHTSDASQLVNFNTTNQALGFWNVMVTNSNGMTSTLNGALFIDFQGGSVTMLDNLIRPRLGGKTKITVTIYEGGTVSVKLYTLSGAHVATLIDDTLPAGTFTYSWDGTTASGQAVASGVYLVKVTGPKLDATNKIVVIK